MKSTRERLTVDKKKQSNLILRHRAIYEFCSQHVLGKRVLDLGCGDGYGSFLLAKKAKEVVALDVDRPTIDTAKIKYRLKNLFFCVGDAGALPPLELFDVVVSLQVIEHMEDDRMFLLEITRMLKKNGVLMLATPNRKVRLKNDEEPWNPFHFREYDKDGLEKLLLRYFVNVKILGLTATRAAYDIEMKRLRLRRVIAKLDPFGLYNLIPQEWSNRALALWKKFILKGARQKIYTKDFFVKREGVDTALDLIAVSKLTKSRPF